MVVGTRVYISGRKNGSVENICPSSGYIYDASLLVDYLKKLHDGVFDYVVIAPEVHFQTYF